MAKTKEGFAKIERTHVEEACRLLVKGGAGGWGGSYFVRFEGSDLPAKRVLLEAYQRANQSEIGAKEFSGGQYTARILQRLGFEVVVPLMDCHTFLFSRRGSSSIVGALP
jgi:hypothetical protein